MTLTDDLRSRLEQAGLGPISRELVDLSKQSCLMRSVATPEEAIPIGSSKLGGLPDLPPNLGWPRWKTGELDFVAQLNLAEVPTNDLLDLLPTSGLLSFFYDREQAAWGFDPLHKDGFRLWYFPEVSNLVRLSSPNGTSYPSARLSFEPFLSLPNSSELGDLILEIERDETYWEFLAKYPTRGPRHQVLGWPRLIQNPMELECQLASNGIYVGNPSGYKDPRRKELEPGASDWMLLLQIDSDDGTKMMWGDGGMLYVWIRYQDLKQSNFEKTWTILQCF